MHSAEGDEVLDFFAGSGTTGVAADRLGRRFTLVDNNPEAIHIMQGRLADTPCRLINATDKSRANETGMD